LSHLLEIPHSLLLPVAVPFKLPRHQLRYSWSGFNAGPSAQQQGRGPARKYVLDRPRDFCAHGPDNLGSDVQQFRVKFFCQGRLTPKGRILTLDIKPFCYRLQLVSELGVFGQLTLQAAHVHGHGAIGACS
jgi:hypothetical protein